ncbi:MAG: Na+/H+ antiporter NhaA [Gammaproteobacteria bacterium]|nr:Na+/H+ antiporter NhaA [Gammaproteobacteria bacterium]
MRRKTFFRKFSHVESLGGALLFFAAIVAIVISNTSLQPWYHHLFHDMPVSFGIGKFSIVEPIQYWINDGLMAIFFLLVGLEIKRELVVGELSRLSNALLPLVAALGGIVIPAMIYLLVNKGMPEFQRGWAIPTATDIAFSLGVLSLLKSRIPTTLKIFLTALAIIDDLGAIIVIAVFYTTGLSWLLVLASFFCITVLVLFNRIGVIRFTPYAIVGFILWLCVLTSGIHATLAGIALAFAYPLQDKKNHLYLPSRKIEMHLHPWVAYLILPIFAFANAGVPFAHVTVSSMVHPITLGIFAGLLFGKPLGIFLACWLAVKTKIASLPRGVNFGMIYGVGILAGIGFTMSLFVGGLAFPAGTYSFMVKVGVFGASFLSGIIGYFVLRRVVSSGQHRLKTAVKPQLPG